MNKYLLIHPGTVSELVSLHAVLAEAHTEAQAVRAKEIADRKAAGAPLDDDTDWGAVSSVDIQRAIASRDSEALAAEAVKLRALVAGNALVAIPDYEPVDGYDGVLLRFIAISEGERQDHMLAVGMAQDAIEAATPPDTGSRAQVLRPLIEARDQALLTFIGATVAEVRCGDQVTGGKRLEPGDLEAIRATGLMVPIFTAARDFQELSPGKGKRFGSLPPST